MQPRGGWKWLALAVVLSVAVRSVRGPVYALHRAGQRYEDIYYLPEPSWLPVLSLGYRQALADLIWCRSLVYFGEQLVHRGEVKYVFAYTDAVIALDPDFRSAYRWVATASIYRPTAVDVEVGLRAAAYLERALERWPDDGTLQWDHGSLLRFELAPLEPDPARKRVLLERAAPSLAAAARLGAGPAWLALNSVQLLDRLGRTEQAARHIEEVLPTITDPGVKEVLTRRLHALRSAAYTEAADEAATLFYRAHQQTYPYLSEGLFLLLSNETFDAASSAEGPESKSGD